MLFLWIVSSFDFPARKIEVGPLLHAMIAIEVAAFFSVSLRTGESPRSCAFKKLLSPGISGLV